MKCRTCERATLRERVGYSHCGVNLGCFEADCCHNCGEVRFTEASLSAISRKAREHSMLAGNVYTTLPERRIHETG